MDDPSVRLLVPPGARLNAWLHLQNTNAHLPGLTCLCASGQAALYCTVLHGTASYGTALHGIVSHDMALHCMSHLGCADQQLAAIRVCECVRSAVEHQQRQLKLLHGCHHAVTCTQALNTHAHTSVVLVCTAQQEQQKAGQSTEASQNSSLTGWTLPCNQHGHLLWYQLQHQRATTCAPAAHASLLNRLCQLHMATLVGAWVLSNI